MLTAVKQRTPGSLDVDDVWPLVVMMVMEAQNRTWGHRARKREMQMIKGREKKLVEKDHRWTAERTSRELTASTRAWCRWRRRKSENKTKFGEILPESRTGGWKQCVPHYPAQCGSRPAARTGSFVAATHGFLLPLLLLLLLLPPPFSSSFYFLPPFALCKRACRCSTATSE